MSVHSCTSLLWIKWPQREEVRVDNLEDAEAVNHLLMTIVENVPHKLVVNAEAVFKIRSGEYGIAKLAAELRFDVFNRRNELRTAQIIPHHQDVEPAVEVPHKHSRCNHELYVARALEALDDVTAPDRRGADEQCLEFFYIRKLFIEAPAGNALAAGLLLYLGLRAAAGHIFHNPIKSLSLDKTDLRKHGEFIAHHVSVYLGAADHIFGFETLLGIKKKKPQNLDDAAAPKEFAQDVHENILPPMEIGAQTKTAPLRAVFVVQLRLAISG